MDTKSLVINTKLELRLPDAKYAKALFQIVDQQRDYLGEWLPWVQQTKSVVDSFAFLKTSKAFNNGGQKLVTFIFHENELIGSVALVKISKENKSAELGYWLSESFQGKGIATLCCQKLLKYVFEKMDINRVEINVASTNKKSLEIPKKLGFQHEGTLREQFYFNEKFHDMEKFSLLKREFKLEKKIVFPITPTK